MSEPVEFSPDPWVREQTEQVLATGTTAGLSGPAPSVLLTVRGARTGKLRYQIVIRVEHEGRYAVVASNDGLDRNPAWYFNIRANPVVHLQDGTRTGTYLARELAGEEKAQWWQRAVAVLPRYAEYQAHTARPIPVFVLEPEVHPGR
ncbi:nitroreductase family deazaflavin-dependent oxidoreductase [Kineosporia rhizophila]|uniref:nitroreductase family deazaflavin-dependent oxidoreductase n=1 Tax=Kineosporia TaxID=49184 RepID=UPI001E4B0835|nr:MULTISPECIES: nitroreductase family deazaflavin-dependent oxidoreductase [Kineosporia]MCE0537593.1 nitroreductase family deazaflavin-dependent oxidoreductase [Kineosporia rhizophila]GLY18893.1 nitroreductase [Kineosporia sp. NBRC 101677]